MNVVLIMVRENGDRRSFALTRDTTIIGRREDADFRIPLTDVSRKHCRLIKADGRLRVEDLGSSNGTLHNGNRVKTAELEPGDKLQIGPILFVVQIDGDPAEDELGERPRSRSASPTAQSTRREGAGPPPAPPPSFDSSTFDVINPSSDSGIELEPPAAANEH